MDYNTALATIITWITDNNNKEITAAIMRDVLKTLLDFSDENIGDTANLFQENNTVDAINELYSLVNGININAPLRVFSGTDNPNITPPITSFAAPDIYVRQDGALKNVYMFDGNNWVQIMNVKIGVWKDSAFIGNASSINFAGGNWIVSFDPITGQASVESTGVGVAELADIGDVPAYPNDGQEWVLVELDGDLTWELKGSGGGEDYVKSTADFDTAGRVVIVDSAGRKVAQGSKLLAELITEEDVIDTPRQYTAGQGTAIGSLTIASGSVTPDIAAKNAYSLTIDQNVTINAPSNDRCTSWFIHCTITGAGGWTIGLNSAYKPDGGAALTIPNTTGDKFTLYIQSFGDGTHDITIHTQQ